MRKQYSGHKAVVYLGFLLLVLQLVLILPVAASADDAFVEMDLYAYNYWYPILQTGSAPLYTLEVGQSTKATFQVQAPHLVGVWDKGNDITVNFPTVTGATYINNLDIYLEIRNDSGVWEKYTGRNNKEVKIEVVKTPTLVTQSAMKFPVFASIDISPYDTVKKARRWAVYMSTTENGIPSSDRLIGVQRQIELDDGTIIDIDSEDERLGGVIWNSP